MKVDYTAKNMMPFYTVDIMHQNVECPWENFNSIPREKISAAKDIID
jgi:hypothetical protein